MKARNRKWVGAMVAAVVWTPGVGQTPPVAVDDQLPLLASSDRQLQMNKRLVFDMYRTVLNGGRSGEASRFVDEQYIQHNPNVASGRQGLVEYIRRTRPERTIPDQIAFPVVTIMAERDLVLVATVSREEDPDAPGESYSTTHFDLFRVSGDRIVEHWDNVPRSAAAARRDPNESIR